MPMASNQTIEIKKKERDVLRLIATKKAENNGVKYRINKNI